MKIFYFTITIYEHWFSTIERPLSVDHFTQNGNIKSIAHIDADANIEHENDGNLQKRNLSAEIVNEKNSLEKSDIELAAPESKSIDKRDSSIDEKDDKESGQRFYLFRYPIHKRIWQQVIWIIIWPMELLFFLTIPNCEKKRFQNLFPLTFLMCIIWIGSLSYLVAWMITIVGMFSNIINEMK